MDKKTLIAVVLSVVIIVGGMLLQSVLSRESRSRAADDVTAEHDPRGAAASDVPAGHHPSDVGAGSKPRCGRHGAFHNRHGHRGSDSRVRAPCLTA